MAKVVPFFTYVLDLPLLYLWWIPARPRGVSRPRGPPRSRPRLLRPGPTAPAHRGAAHGAASGVAERRERCRARGTCLDPAPALRPSRAPAWRRWAGAGQQPPGPPGPQGEHVQGGDRAALTAGDVQQLAVDGGHPQVGGAGVEDDGEALRGGPDADLPVVLRLGWRGGTGPVSSQARGLTSPRAQRRAGRPASAVHPHLPLPCSVLVPPGHLGLQSLGTALPRPDHVRWRRGEPTPWERQLNWRWTLGQDRVEVPAWGPLVLQASRSGREGPPRPPIRTPAGGPDARALAPLGPCPMGPSLEGRQAEGSWWPTGEGPQGRP